MRQDLEYVTVTYWEDSNCTDVDVYNADQHFVGYERFDGNVKILLDGIFDLLGFEKDMDEENHSRWYPYSQETHNNDIAQQLQNMKDIIDNMQKRTEEFRMKLEENRRKYEALHR